MQDSNQARMFIICSLSGLKIIELQSYKSALQSGNKDVFMKALKSVGVNEN